MRLIIGTESTTDVEKGIMTIPTAALKLPAVHMFIASHTWDSVDIQAFNEVPNEDLRGMNYIKGTVRVPKDIQLDNTSVGKLVTLFPELAGNIRRCYMFQGSINDALKDHVIGA